MPMVQSKDYMAKPIVFSGGKKLWLVDKIITSSIHWKSLLIVKVGFSRILPRRCIFACMENPFKVNLFCIKILWKGQTGSNLGTQIHGPHVGRQATEGNYFIFEIFLRLVLFQSQAFFMEKMKVSDSLCITCSSTFKVQFLCSECGTIFCDQCGCGGISKGDIDQQSRKCCCPECNSTFLALIKSSN